MDEKTHEARIVQVKFQLLISVLYITFINIVLTMARMFFTYNTISWLQFTINALLFVMAGVQYFRGKKKYYGVMQQ